MCVIVIKNKGVKMPDDENIESMWERNSDGAGFMYAVDEEVVIEKGFMTLRDFNNALAGAEKRLKGRGYEVVDVPFVLHFRITTHGGTNAENTHPFPVTYNRKSLHSLDVITDLGMAHNGIIQNTPRSVKISDTIEFILAMVMPVRVLNKDFLNFESTVELFKNSINGSRLVFLDKFGKITVVGEWKKGTETGTEDLLYSNLLHEPWDDYYVGKYSKSNWSNPNKEYTPKPFKTTPILVKPLEKGYGYAVMKEEDILGVELLYPKEQQFDGKDRPYTDDLNIQLIDKTPNFLRYADRYGYVHYQTVVNKKAKLRLVESVYWKCVVKVDLENKTYRIMQGKDIAGKYIRASVVKYI